MEEFDLIVIGGGPGGYAAAISAARAGLKTALFEKKRLGGTCLNEGCIPTKYLAEKAGDLEKIRDLVQSGIVREPGFFSYKKIQKGKRAVSEKLVGGVGFLLKKAGVSVIEGSAILNPGRRISCGGREYIGKSVIIATGARPIFAPVPGRELCIGSREALELERLPKTMTVIGGGVIGLEMAAAFAAYGVGIELIEAADRLLPEAMLQAAELVLRGMEKSGVSLNTGARLTGVEKEGKLLRAEYEQNGQRKQALSELVLMAIGRSANLDGIDAEALGLDRDEGGFLKTDAAMKTSAEGVYAIGDVAGGAQLASIAYAGAHTALTDILGAGSQTGSPLVPRCIHTIPCYAAVGLTPQEAEKRGIETLTGSFSYGANGMALAKNASGSVFAVMDKNTQRTLGFTIVGAEAEEMISFAAQSVERGLSLEQWEAALVPHPSLSEMLREAALDAFGRSVHKA